ncbi:MAG: NDP-hexose C3-ketoreductase / dTDP-4-oxo-2-deoxy-alpha-D-pentos-2-ene 2,3-reductase, partial [Micromonosporaceae bacterium]|nr:NDP-hexose C3-ketoreductase / dTDP-4-oxo-2-deoxy-alpha-D-pentos-2-ene 2,3-reductase [Micromonosporaceae bacterium]
GSGSRSGEGRASESLDRIREAFEAYERLAAELSVDPADLALAWLLSRPGVTAPIVGPRTGEQLDNSLRALDVTLDDKTLARLDELFPPIGNGGPGPEAWAW